MVLDFDIGSLLFFEEEEEGMRPFYCTLLTMWVE